MPKICSALSILSPIWPVSNPPFSRRPAFSVPLLPSLPRLVFLALRKAPVETLSLAKLRLQSFDGCLSPYAMGLSSQQVVDLLYALPRNVMHSSGEKSETLERAKLSLQSFDGARGADGRRGAAVASAAHPLGSSGQRAAPFGTPRPALCSRLYVPGRPVAGVAARRGPWDNGRRR